MIRRCALIGVAILCVVAVGQPASALTKVRIPIPITSNPVEFDGFCPFPMNTKTCEEPSSSC